MRVRAVVRVRVGVATSPNLITCSTFMDVVRSAKSGGLPGGCSCAFRFLKLRRVVLGNGST